MTSVSARITSCHGKSRKRLQALEQARKREGLMLWFSGIVDSRTAVHGEHIRRKQRFDHLNLATRRKICFSCPCISIARHVHTFRTPCEDYAGIPTCTQKLKLYQPRPSCHCLKLNWNWYSCYPCRPMQNPHTLTSKTCPMLLLWDRLEPTTFKVGCLFSTC